MVSSLVENFKELGAKNALVYKGREYTYLQLSNEIDRIRFSVIADKIQSGEVVSILSDYSF